MAGSEGCSGWMEPNSGVTMDDRTALSIGREADSGVAGEGLAKRTNVGGSICRDSRATAMPLIISGVENNVT
jgi:hypothetical protein